MKIEPFRVLNIIAQTLLKKKGFNILGLDVRGISTFTDYFLIGEGNVDKHVVALAKDVVDRLRKEGETPMHVEGIDSGDWIVIDYLEIVVHLFKPGLREKYRLEQLWCDGLIVDLDFGDGAF